MKHYTQAEEYSCDPACLMMAMHELGNVKMGRKLEMQIWKEANLTTVPGCLPQGLALSAVKRGFGAEIICRKEHMHETTKEDNVSMRVAKEQEKKCIEAGVKMTDKSPAIRDAKNALRNGSVPLVLVSAEKIHGIKSPHWVAVSRIRNDSVYFHDPLLKKEISLAQGEFSDMCSQVKDFLNRRMLIISRR